jgi:hypothetical protein
LEVVPISQTERRINKLYANFCVIRKEVSLSIIKATNRALPLAIELGGLLVEHKERIGHGNWETWVAAQEFSLATAKRWMALNRRREEVERSGVENLDEAYLLLGLKTPKRSPVSDLTDSDADTDTPDWRHFLLRSRRPRSHRRCRLRPTTSSRLPNQPSPNQYQATANP